MRPPPIFNAWPGIIGPAHALTHALVLALALSGCALLPNPSQQPPQVSEPQPPASQTPPATQPPSPAPVTPPAAAVPAPAQKTDETVQMAALLSASRLFGGMKPEEQRQELNEATQNFNRDRSSYARVRLALLLAMPETGLEDEARAATLLEPVVKGAPGPLRDIAAFIAGQLGARAGEKRRAAQFKEQLDQLRAVDRSLLERGQSRGR